MLSKVIYMRSEYVVIKGKVTFEHIFRKKTKKKNVEHFYQLRTYVVDISVIHDRGLKVAEI